MRGTAGSTTGADALYAEAARQFGAAIARLAATSEFDPDRARDLEQDIHVALWRSLHGFDGKCSLKTWTYRVAHNVAASHVRKAAGPRLVPLASITERPECGNLERETAERDARERLRAELRSMNVADAQVALLYLEGLTAAEIGEVAGLDAGAVSVRIHRIKIRLTEKFSQGEC